MSNDETKKINPKNLSRGHNKPQNDKKNEKKEKKLKLTSPQQSLLNKANEVDKKVKKVVNGINLENITAQEQLSDAALILKMSNLIDALKQNDLSTKVEVVTAATDIGKDLIDFANDVENKNTIISKRFLEIVKSANFMGVKQSAEQHSKIFNDLRKMVKTLKIGYDNCSKSNHYEINDLQKTMLDGMPLQYIKDYVAQKEKPVKNTSPTEKAENKKVATKVDEETCSLEEATKMLELKSTSHVQKHFIDTGLIKTTSDGLILVSSVQELKDQRSVATSNKQPVEEKVATTV